MRPDPLPLGPIVDRLRRHDRERYLLVLLAPADAREDIAAIYGFNYEIARTREVVSEPALGAIRLQWWRDAIDAIYAGSTAPRHDVVDALAVAIRRRGLDRRLLDETIDARERDLADTAPATMEALEDYAERTAGHLLRLHMEVIGKREEASMAAAADVGVAAALIGLSRTVPFHARQRRVYLPTALVEEVKLELGALFELKPHDAVRAAVRRLVELAEARLASARARRAELSAPARRALLGGVGATLQARRLRRHGYDVFDPRAIEMPPLLPLAMTLAACAGRY